MLPVSPPLESAFHEHRNLVLVIEVALESISDAKNPAFILWSSRKSESFPLICFSKEKFAISGIRAASTGNIKNTQSTSMWRHLSPQPSSKQDWFDLWDEVGKRKGIAFQAWFLYHVVDNQLLLNGCVAEVSAFRNSLFGGTKFQLACFPDRGPTLDWRDSSAALQNHDLGS